VAAGRCCRRSSVALPQDPHDAAAVADVGSAGRLPGVHQPRPLSERPDRRCPPAARTWRGTQQVSAEPSRCPRNRTPRQCPRCGWACGRVLAGRLLFTADTAAALSRTETPRPPVADRPGTPTDCGSGTGRHLPTLPGCPRCLRNCGYLAVPSGRLDGSRGAGVRSAADLDAGSVRCPPLLPQPAAGVRTPGVRSGHCRSRRVSAATGTGRLADGHWRGAATAGRRGPAGGRAGRRAERAPRSWPAAPTPGPPRPSAC
jgi:hypothetical protein